MPSGKTTTPNTDSIEQWVDAKSYERALRYHRDGAVFNGRREGRTISASCEGSQGGPYQVQVALDSKGGVKSADCSCPVGEGGRCKHVAALLLAWRDRRAEFEAVEPLERALAGRDKAALVSLVRQMVRVHPDLRALVSGGKRPADSGAYRKQALAVLRGAAAEGYLTADAVRQLKALVGIGDELRGRHEVPAAVAVYQGVAAACVEKQEAVDDDAGRLADVIYGCADGLSNCLAETEDAGLRLSALRTMFEIYRAAWGGEEVEQLILDAVNPAERREVAEWVGKLLPASPAGDGSDWDGWQRAARGRLLLELRGDELGDEAALDLCRRTGQIDALVDRLLALGRLDDALAAAAAVEDYRLLDLATHFVTAGHPQAGEGLVLRRLRASPQDVLLLEWLERFHVTQGNPVDALAYATRSFRARPGLDGYQMVKGLATAAGGWDALRETLLGQLAVGRHISLLIRIHLFEGDVAAGLRAFDDRGATPVADEVVAELARAAEASHPEVARALHRRLVERQIGHGNRDHYREACGHLRKIKKLSSSDEWSAFAAALHESHDRKRAFWDEFRKAKL